MTAPTTASAAGEVARQLALAVSDRLYVCETGTYLHGVLTLAREEQAGVMVRPRLAGQDSATRKGGEASYYFSFFSGMTTTTGRNCAVAPADMMRTLILTPPREATPAEAMLWALRTEIVSKMDDVRVEAVIDDQRTYWLLNYRDNPGGLTARPWRGPRQRTA